MKKWASLALILCLALVGIGYASDYVDVPVLVHGYENGGVYAADGESVVITTNGWDQRIVTGTTNTNGYYGTNLHKPDPIPEEMGEDPVLEWTSYMGAPVNHNWILYDPISGYRTTDIDVSLHNHIFDGDWGE